MKLRLVKFAVRFVTDADRARFRSRKRIPCNLLRPGKIVSSLTIGIFGPFFVENNIIPVIAAAAIIACMTDDCD